MKEIITEWRKYVNENKGPFNSSALQLFMPSLTQCNGRKCSLEHFKANMPTAVGDMDMMFAKPKGGLWTATAHKIEEGVYDSSWTEWVQRNARHWFNPRGILIEPKSTNVFHIETDKDIKKLEKNFPKKKSSDPSHLQMKSEWEQLGYKFGPEIDWKRALSDEGYDGIHWGMKDGSDSRSSFGINQAWDVESTCWRSDAVQKGILVPVGIVEISKNK